MVCCTREAFRNLPASARPPPVAAAASAEPSLLPPPSSRPRRSTSEVQRRLAATPVVARRFGSTQGAPRRPSCQPALSATLPLRMTTSVLSQALRTPRAGQLPLIINWISLWPLQVTLSVQRRRPPSLTSAFSQRARPSHVTLVEVCDQTHEYCELFMIIRSLSIQSHDKLGAAAFKLMIIFVCCIQTQLIVFMPNAARRPPSPAPARR